MSLIPPGVSSRCRCGRAASHIHYSSNHDFFVKFGLICFLLAEGMSFIEGWVKGSTTVYLSSAVIGQYESVTSSIAELIAPYGYLNWLADGLELITLVLAISAVALLRSIKDRNTHGAAIVGAIATFTIGMITKLCYISATNAALTRLPTLVDAQTLDTARQVEEQFQAAYGFWGTPGPNACNMIFSLAGLALFAGALITYGQFTVWQPGSADVSRPPPPPSQGMGMDRKRGGDLKKTTRGGGSMRAIGMLMILIGAYLVYDLVLSIMDGLLGENEVTVGSLLGKTVVVIILLLGGTWLYRRGKGVGPQVEAGTEPRKPRKAFTARDYVIVFVCFFALILLVYALGLAR